ncbi:MAG: hypothetical protein AAF557_02780 [Pseudomonadota bacterium]
MEVSITRFVPVPTDTGSPYGFEAFYNVFSDNPLILLIFVLAMLILLLRWRHRHAFRRYHGPKLKHEIDLYLNARKHRITRSVPMVEAKQRKEDPRPEFNVEGRRVN